MANIILVPTDHMVVQQEHPHQLHQPQDEWLNYCMWFGNGGIEYDINETWYTPYFLSFFEFRVKMTADFTGDILIQRRFLPDRWGILVCSPQANEDLISWLRKHPKLFQFTAPDDKETHDWVQSNLTPAHVIVREGWTFRPSTRCYIRCRDQRDAALLKLKFG